MEIKLAFLGAAQNVTGSRYLVEVDGFKAMVDCGLYQERKLADRNWARFPTPAEDIDAVLLTHAHLDHCGLLPKLVKEGFSGKIYCTAATAQIAQIILMDCAHIQEEDAEYKRERHKREGRADPRPIVPLYTTEDAQRCEKLFSPIPYRQPQTIGKGVQAVFYDAGHVLGSSMIKLTIDRNGETRSILFSGDVGRDNKPIIEDPDVIDHADYVLVESTYGDRVHKPAEEVEDQLCRVINETVQAGGNLVVPCFSLERSQELLYHLNELLLAKRIPQLKVFLDSPMAISITKVFRQHPELFDAETLERLAEKRSPFDLPGLKMTETTSESKAIKNVKGTAIILAGSGMCTGGRIKHHLVNNITEPDNTVLFIGYQAEGTLGRAIASGAEEVRILGRMLPVKARVANIGGFSAHADKNELLEWLSGLQRAPRGVFVVHGEVGAARHFGDFVREKTGWNVTVPQYKDEVVLD